MLSLLEMCSIRSLMTLIAVSLSVTHSGQKSIALYMSVARIDFRPFRRFLIECMSSNLFNSCCPLHSQSLTMSPNNRIKKSKLQLAKCINPEALHKEKNIF